MPARTLAPEEITSARRAKVHGALAVMQVLFGLLPVAGTAALAELTPPAMIGARMIGSGLLFVVIALIYGARSKPTPRDLLALAGLALLGVTGNQLLYAEGLLRAGPVNAAVLMVSIPALTVLVAMIAKKEPPRPRRIGGVAIAICGALLLLPLEKADFSSSAMAGNLLLLSNFLCYATFLVFVRPYITKLGAAAVVGWVFAFGAIEALPWITEPLIETTWHALPGWLWATLAFIVAGPTVAAYGLNSYALRWADASLVAVYFALQPFIAALGAWLILGAEVPLRSAIAGLVIITGVIVSSRKQ